MSLDRLSSVEEEKDGKFRDRKIVSLEPFPVDDTPTPTKILRMANDLFPDFQDPKENPFDAHFRKAAEAVKSGRIKRKNLFILHYLFIFYIY